MDDTRSRAVPYERLLEEQAALRRVAAPVVVEVVDDGVGGAAQCAGSGLRGLADRVEALGGTVALESPVHGGTRLRAEIPNRLR